jgi:hypothetical protein
MTHFTFILCLQKDRGLLRKGTCSNNECDNVKDFFTFIEKQYNLSGSLLLCFELDDFEFRDIMIKSQCYSVSSQIYIPPVTISSNSNRYPLFLNTKLKSNKYYYVFQVNYE